MLSMSLVLELHVHTSGQREGFGLQGEGEAPLGEPTGSMSEFKLRWLAWALL